MTTGRRRYGSKRSKENGPPFVQMFHWVTQCPAWRDLGPNGQAVYVALKRYYDGTNNGQIGFSCRQAAEAIGMSVATASRSLQDLVTHGFIVEVTKGVVGRGSGYNLATEWLLTECYDDRNRTPATKQFMKWAKTENTVSNSGPSVSPAQRSGRIVPEAQASRFTGVTQNRKHEQDTFHGRNTLTSSHAMGPRNETRGAAGPHERSKPRVAGTDGSQTAIVAYPIGGVPPAGFVPLGARIDSRLESTREPMMISEALREVLERTRAKGAGEPAGAAKEDRSDA